LASKGNSWWKGKLANKENGYDKIPEDCPPNFWIVTDFNCSLHLFLNLEKLGRSIILKTMMLDFAKISIELINMDGLYITKPIVAVQTKHFVCTM
jgi:hypothetical protein